MCEIFEFIFHKKELEPANLCNFPVKKPLLSEQKITWLMPLYFVIWHHAYHYGFGKSTSRSSNTLPETNSSHLPGSAMSKRKDSSSNCKSSICRCELLVSGRVFFWLTPIPKRSKKVPRCFNKGDPCNKTEATGRVMRSAWETHDHPVTHLRYEGNF